LSKLGLEIANIHLHKYLAGFNPIPFPRQHFGNPAGALGGDVVLNRLDAAVARGESRRQLRIFPPQPSDAERHS
jgi:hypothetical protein